MMLAFLLLRLVTFTLHCPAVFYAEFKNKKFLLIKWNLNDVKNHIDITI